MLKKLFAITLISMAAASNHAFACAQSQVEIEGLGVGGGVNAAGVCEVAFEVKKIVKQHPVCPLYVKVGQEITVPTSIPPEDCPMDEVTVKGTLYNGGSGFYHFRGSIR